MSTKQQFSLRWTNYLRHVTTAFDKLRCMDDLVDVTLCCEGRKIKAHKMLLSACSTYFKEIFLENPCQHPVIIFRNVRYDDLCAIINFMYQGEVNVAHDQLASFLTTAELLEVQGLTDSSETDQENVTEVSIGKTESNQPLPGAKRHKPNQKKRTDSDSDASIDQNSDIEPININLTQHSNFKEEIADEENLEDANMDITDNITPGPSATSFHEEIEICESDAFQATNVLDNLKTSDVNNSQSNTNIDLTQELIVDGASREIPQGVVDWSTLLASQNHVSGNTVIVTAAITPFGDGVKLQCESKQVLNDIEKISKQSTCNICSKVFMHPNSLAHHKKAHREETQCSICNKSYTRTYDLKRHMRTSHSINCGR